MDYVVIVEVNFLLREPQVRYNLAEALKQHPEIVMSNPKEPNMIGTQEALLAEARKRPT